MNGPEDNPVLTYSRANDSAARVIAYFSPYLFWGTVSVIAAGIFMIG